MLPFYASIKYIYKTKNYFLLENIFFILSINPSFFPIVSIVRMTTIFATPILTPKGRGAEITESTAEREKVSADIIPIRAIFFVFKTSPHYNIGRNFIF